MTQRRAVIALDLGGTKIAAGLFLEHGEILYQKIVPTVQDSAEKSIAQIASLVHEAILHAPRDVSAVAVGVAVPGWVNHKARTVWAPNITGWDHLPLQEKLQPELPAPLVLDSDRAACVKGEAWLGVARGLADVVFLAVGTGIGAGILSGGRMIHGHEDLAGAVGWLALNPKFREIYARMGCFEAEASGAAIARRAKGVSARAVIESAEKGNAEARALLDEAASYIGMGIANLVSTLNPQIVVLGGGLFQSGTYLVEKVREEVPRWAQPFAAKSVRLELSALGERAGLAGAARIAFDNV